MAMWKISSIVSSLRSCRPPVLRSTFYSGNRSYTTTDANKNQSAFSDIKAGYVDLGNRSVVQVAGPDATTLLHNLVTNEVRTLQPRQAVYAHFLNSGGKMQFEALLALAASGASGPEWLLDVATADQPQLLRTLSLYKLRSKVRVQASPLVARVVLGPPPTLSAALAASLAGACTFADPRLPQLGVRSLLSADAAWPPAELQLRQLPEHLLRAYRMLQGVAEAPELPANSVSLEMNLELLNGVSFAKGCYIGQELMARTHHTGVVRKRVMPCLVFNERRTPNWAALADEVRRHLQQPSQALLPRVITEGQCENVSAGAELTASGKTVGRVLACESGVALVLLRLEALAGDPPRIDGAPELIAVPLLPSFFPRGADSAPKP